MLRRAAIPMRSIRSPQDLAGSAFSDRRWSLAAAASVIDLDVTVFIQLGIFLFLFLVLRPLLFRRLVDLFAAREKSIEGAQAEARKMDEESRVKTAAYEEAMKKVRAEAGAERDQLRAEASRTATALVTAARAKETSRLEAGKKQIHAEAESVRGDLRTRARDLGLDLSRRVLGRDPGSPA